MFRYCIQIIAGMLQLANLEGALPMGALSQDYGISFHGAVKQW